MKQEVTDQFFEWSQRFESYCDWMYLDVRGLVTIGIGNLIEPKAYAMSCLDYTGGDPGVAWDLVKSRQDMKLHGGEAFAALTTVRATPDSIKRLCNQRLAQMESTLKQVFTEWEDWPWQAQLATLSLSWALGPAFTLHWPKFTADCKKQDWASAAVDCHMSESGQNQSFRDRNAANKQLFLECVNT